MNQKRQPKGTENGGQFAPDANPESTLDLSPEPAVADQPDTPPSIFTIAERESIIRRIEGEVDGIYDAKIEREPGGGDTLDQLIEDGDEIVSLKNAVIHHQEQIIAAQRRELDALRKNVGHEAPFQIGSVLEYDVEVVEWVPGIHEENVAVQVWMKEWGDADTDCAGWEPRAIAQIARERGIANVTNRDLQDILDDPDIDKIAFRPDTSIERLIKQINALNKEDSTS